MRRQRCLEPLSRESIIPTDCSLFLIVPQTCNRLNKALEEHQTWLDQVKRLQIPIPTGVIPSMAELKDWAVSWIRSNELWVKPREDGNGRPLSVHCFETPFFDDGCGPDRFVMAKLIPGGRFVVVLYIDCSIELREINIKSNGDWELREVAQHRQDDQERFDTVSRSLSNAVPQGQLLTETDLGRPLVAYVDCAEEKYRHSFSKLSSAY